MHKSLGRLVAGVERRETIRWLPNLAPPRQVGIPKISAVPVVSEQNQPAARTPGRIVLPIRAACLSHRIPGPHPPGPFVGVVPLSRKAPSAEIHESPAPLSHP